MADIINEEQLSAKQLYDLTKTCNHLYILDVRSAMEYERYHIKGAININIEYLSLDKALKLLNLNYNDKAIFVTYCNAGGRGGRSFLMLKEQNQALGSSQIMVKNLQHGINQWINAGYEILENI